MEKETNKYIIRRSELSTLNINQSNAIFFYDQSEEIMRIDKDGMTYKGALINDAGAVYELMKNYLTNMQNNTNKSNTKTPRFVTLFEGDDWHGPKGTHLVIPERINLEEEKGKWEQWNQNRNTLGIQDQYSSFADWIKKEGAREVNKLEQFWVD